MSDSETLPAETAGDGAIADASFRSAPIEQLEGQVNDIQEVMDGLMREGTHYDDITGDGRNSLLQPGAEKLCFAFKFAPSFDVERRDYAPEDVPNADEPVEGHREYIVNCELTHRPTGQYVGSGRGSCSTLESKYRYRKIDKETQVPIPGEFWDSYDDSMANADFSILEEELAANGVDLPDGGEAGVTKDDSGEWRITIQAKGENPDIADLYNTVLKMAEKRALVNAVKRSTAASDIFTQDTEDLAHLDGSDVQGQRKRRPSGKANGSSRTPQKNGPSGSPSKKKSTTGQQEGTSGDNPEVSWQAPAGDTFDGIHPNAKTKLEEWDDKLSEVEDTDLAARVTAIRDNVSWDGPEANALSRLLSDHEQRLADYEEHQAEEAAAENEPQDPDEVKAAAEGVETASEEANDAEFEDDSDLPF